MSAASSARNAIKNVTAPKPPRKPLFHFVFHTTPKALNNPIRWTMTQQIASDPAHPLHIRTQRRLTAFDPNKLHWTVKAPVDLSKKAIVRNWAVRRVKEAFRLELENSGWTKDGQVLGENVKEGLKGALCVYLGKDAMVVMASWDDVRKECAWLVQKIVGLQNANGNRRNGAKDRGARHGSRKENDGRGLRANAPSISENMPFPTDDSNGAG